MDKYNMALQRAKDEIEKGVVDREVFEAVFPELKESAAEKCIKEIYNFLHELRYGRCGGPKLGTAHVTLERWLKFLSNCQTTWTEEDEEICQAIIKCLDENVVCGLKNITDGSEVWLNQAKRWLEGRRYALKPADLPKFEHWAALNKILIMGGDRLNDKECRYLSELDKILGNIITQK